MTNAYLANITLSSTSTPESPFTSLTALDGTVLTGNIKIKVTGKPAIYWLDENMNYYYYPDGDVFKSWNVDESYSGYYKAISQEVFEQLSPPSQAPYHVSYRNGSELVKNISSDQIYVVGLNNVLYPITNAAARALYGTNYKAKSIGLSEWPYYTKDNTMTVGVNTVYPGMFIKVDGKNYFVDTDKALREIRHEHMYPNHLKPAYFRNVSVSTVLGLSKGADIAFKASELISFIGY
jgi:hypothetical protein